jgi:hypothetical protein
MVTRGLGWVLCFYDGLAGPTGPEDIRTGPSDPSLSNLASGVGDGIAATSFVWGWPAARLPNTFVLFVHISCRNGQRNLGAQATRPCCAHIDTSREIGHGVT